MRIVATPDRYLKPEEDLLLSSQAALQRLKEGNRRFLEGKQLSRSSMQKRRMELVAEQKPYAIILSCSDSRVPPELIFDESLGDLFVIRVAGNIATPTQVGSIEFAAEKFGTRLIVVLGHSQCGAVAAAVGQFGKPIENLSPNLLTIVEELNPSIESLINSDSSSSQEVLLQQAVRANAFAAAEKLTIASDAINTLVQEDGLMIVSAEYSLETGTVEFFDTQEG